MLDGAAAHLAVPLSRLPDVVGQPPVAIGLDVCDHAARVHHRLADRLHDAGKLGFGQPRLGHREQFIQGHGCGCRWGASGDGVWGAGPARRPVQGSECSRRCGVNVAAGARGGGLGEAANSGNRPTWDGLASAQAMGALCSPSRPLPQCLNPARPCWGLRRVAPQSSGENPSRSVLTCRMPTRGPCHT
jgi:hypothetical protein